ncbi:MAG: hypothetical protein R3F62_16095 [Planctomycetota bacterium]
MAERAELVVHGVVSVTKAEKSDDGAIVTQIEVDVVEALKGTPGETFTFTVYGGILGNRGSAIAGAPTFKRGEELVVFLTAENSKGLRTAIGLAQGKFSVREEKGQKLAFRNMQGLRLVDPKTGEEEDPKRDQGVALDQLLDRIRRAVKDGSK